MTYKLILSVDMRHRPTHPDDQRRRQERRERSIWDRSLFPNEAACGFFLQSRHLISFAAVGVAQPASAVSLRASRRAPISAGICSPAHAHVARPSQSRALQSSVPASSLSGRRRRSRRCCLGFGRRFPWHSSCSSCLPCRVQRR